MAKLYLQGPMRVMYLNRLGGSTCESQMKESLNNYLITILLILSNDVTYIFVIFFM